MSDHRAPSEGGRNVVLTGFMATGKTTVGRVLAVRLGYDFVDTDAVIVQRHGAIAEIFAEHGEAYFRELERDVAAELAGRARLVIATGGRMLLDADNAAALSATGDVVCLTASIDTIVDRVTAEGIAHRPMLTGDDVRARVAALLAERAAGYAQFRAVATDARTADEIADAIVTAVGQSRPTTTSRTATPPSP